MTEKDLRIDFINRKDLIVISVNYDYDLNLTDYIFISNLRRFRELPPENRAKSIVTSNISTTDAFLQVSYKELLNDSEYVQDNAGLMLIKFLISIGVKQIYLAGMDGYSSNPEEDYANKSMIIYTGNDLSNSKNSGMISVLREMQKHAKIEFVTTPKYLQIQ